MWEEKGVMVKKLSGVRHVKRVVLTSFLLLFLCVTVLRAFFPAFNLSVLASPEETTVTVDPLNSSANPGQNFTVNIGITNVTELWEWDVRLEWKTGLLEAVEAQEGPFLSQDGAKPTSRNFKIYNYAGYIDLVCFRLDWGGTNGTGILANVTFTVTGTGNTTLNLSDTTLVKSDLATELPHTAEDGNFYTTLPVARFTYTPHPLYYPGHPIVNETVTFNGTASFDPDDPYEGSPGGIVSYNWDFDDGTNGTGSVVNHTYSGAGSYVVTLNVTDDDGESDLIDQPTIGTSISVQLHDIAVINITVTPSEVSLGDAFTIDVTVLNQGSDVETLNVTAYANMIPVETKLFEYTEIGPPPFYIPQHYTSIESGRNATTEIIWDTTGFPTGNYSISVTAFLVKRLEDKWQSTPDLEREEAMFDNGMFYGNVAITAAASHDLAITEFKVSPASLEIDEWISIEVAVKNKGSSEEQFNATVTIEYESEVSVLKPVAWSNQTIRAGITVRLELLWLKGTATTEEGTYNMTAEVQLVNKTTLEPPSYEDANSADNTFNKEVSIYIKPVASFTYSPAEPSIDETVIFNATESSNPGVPEGTVSLYTWDFGDGTGVEKTSPVTTHVYRLNGTYTVNLIVTDDSSQTDSVQTAVTIRSGMAHILMNITFSPSAAMPGQSISVGVTVRNVGYFEETFNITAYYDENQIGTETDITLECGANTTLTFTWDTTGVPHSYYTIQTVASKLIGVELVENTYVGGTVAIGMGGVGPTGDITISTSPSSLNIGASTIISGSISPVSAGAKVWIHFRLREAETWSNLSMVITDQDGKYASMPWEPQEIGVYALKSILLGEENMTLGESEVGIIVVEESAPPPSIFFYTTIGLAAGLGAVTVGMLAFYRVKVRRGKQG